MKFRTKIDVPQSNWEITPQMRGISIGSCFTNYIGGYLQTVKFPIQVNPFGTVYNPISIAHCFDLLNEKIIITEDDLVLNAGVWSSFLLHGSFSSPRKEEVLALYNEAVSSFKSLESLDYIILTLGTSWVYELVRTQEVVSNCHKFPANTFNRIKLSVQEIEAVLSSLIDDILYKFPNCKIITTISPIRHWKDGAHENQVSKSQLFVAVDSLVQDYSSVEYFPAYELLMDDLRDYRFYEEDLLHPSGMAVKYIRDSFLKTYTSQQTQDFIAKMELINTALNHRVVHKNSSEHVKFKAAMLKKIQTLQTEYPLVSLDKEIKTFLLD